MKKIDDEVLDVIENLEPINELKKESNKSFYPNENLVKINKNYKYNNYFNNVLDTIEKCWIYPFLLLALVIFILLIWAFFAQCI